ncbi:hypothetical protein N9682_02850 [Candidatus Pelagibacter sp.]|jgi:hypothetical protein|nr:hypothetical protein [Candidatus Pelagibacter sp.]
MTDHLKTINQNHKFDFVDIEKVSGHVSKEPVIAFRDICFYVSVSAVDKLELKQFKRVRFSVLKGENFEEAEKLYLRPNNDDFGHNTNNYLILTSRRATGGATISGVASLYKKIPRLAKYLEYRDNANKKLALKQCEKTGLWFMPMTPMLEKTVWDLNKAPEVPAVYRLSFKGHVQNIGQTNNLARRLKEKELLNIPFDKVEYSPMTSANEEKRLEHENYHLERYEKERGSLPPYNFQNGVKKIN